MKTKHSKTPWTYVNVSSFEAHIETENDGKIIAVLTDLLSDCHHEDAKHIVQCVNHFDEMKEILMHLIEANEHTQKVFQSMANRGNYPRELFPDEFVNDNKNLFLGNQGWWYMLEPTEKAKQLLEKLEQYES